MTSPAELESTSDLSHPKTVNITVSAHDTSALAALHAFISANIPPDRLTISLLGDAALFFAHQDCIKSLETKGFMERLQTHYLVVHVTYEDMPSWEGTLVQSENYQHRVTHREGARVLVLPIKSSVPIDKGWQSKPSLIIERCVRILSESLRY